VGRILTVLTLSVSLLTFPATALAKGDKDRAASDRSFYKYQHRKDSDGNHSGKKHADKNYQYEKHQYEKHQNKKYINKKHQYKKSRAETIRQYKLATKHQQRIAAYSYFNGNNYQHWRGPHIYQKHPSYRALRRHYYAPNHERYWTHYQRYHRAHKHSHHQHDDNYLEWVTTMLLLNDLLDDDYP